MKDKVVELMRYGASSSEDAEHFFDAFSRLLKCLGPEYKIANEHEDEDVTMLFDAMDEMLMEYTHRQHRGTTH